MTESVMLTGGTGFLGSRIARRLDEAGYGVVVPIGKDSRVDRLQGCRNILPLEERDPERLASFLAERGIRTVIHAATAYDRSASDPLRVFQANLALPVTLLDAVRRVPGGLFVNCDTFSRPGYGAMQAYIISKAHLRDWLPFYSTSCRIVNLELFQMYGEDDNPEKFAPFVINSLLCEKESIEFTDCLHSRDFVYVGDVSELAVRILERDGRRPGMAGFEVGSGRATRLRDMVTLCKILSGNGKTRLLFGALEKRQGEPDLVLADPSPLKAAYGWQAATPLEAGLEKTINWYKERRDHGQA